VRLEGEEVPANRSILIPDSPRTPPGLIPDSHRTLGVSGSNPRLSGRRSGLLLASRILRLRWPAHRSTPRQSGRRAGRLPPSQSLLRLLRLLRRLLLRLLRLLRLRPGRLWPRVPVYRGIHNRCIDGRSALCSHP
jgi:hypothetical protein